MSATNASIRNTQVTPASNTSHIKQNSTLQTNDYVTNKKIKKEDNYVPVVKNITSETPSSTSQQNGTDNSSSMNGSANMPSGVSSSPPQSESGINATGNHGQSVNTTGFQTSAVNGTNLMNTNENYNTASLNGNTHGMNGLSNGYQSQYPATNGLNGMSQNSIDPTGPLPNEIFELLNEFWRPNELVPPDAHLLNGKFSRRSPDGSLDEAVEEEKEGEDDITSLADTDIGVDRNTQKRRYSRLSDGYERLKSVLPSVKDKRRVSKARILDEAINYIQRLESITNVLKREHEKRLSMLNGSNGFFPDYTVQPYMRSLFQKQMYPPGMSASKMSQYPKMSTTPSTLPKSPRMKQYNQQYTPQNAVGVGSNMGATEYNYNNINTYNASNPLYQSSDPSQLINGDTSPITNNSPYSACSLSPGSTPTTYQNGSGVNNSWPYQGGNLTGYNDSVTSQLSSYSQSRQGSNGYGSSSGYSSLNSSMWGSMGMSEGTPQVVPHADHSMKVG